MERSKVSAYLIMYKNEIPDNKVMLFKKMLEEASDDCETALAAFKTINPIMILLVSIFLGGLGVDRFILGDIGLGVAKLLLSWLTFGIWPLLDIFFCYSKAKELNFKKLAHCFKN